MDRLIVAAATHDRRLSDDEVRQVIEYVARAGFSSGATSPATGLSGMEWQGRRLRGSDRISAAERHYLRPVLRGREWPDGTDLDGYLMSIQ